MRIVLAVAAVMVLAAGCSSKPTYAEQVKACQEVMAAYDFDAHPLKEGQRLPGCESVKQDDYDAIVVDIAIGSLSKEERDALDYYDDGQVNGSIG